MNYRTEKTERIEKKKRLGLQILDNCRIWLYDVFPHLGGAFAGVSHEICENGGIWIDGGCIHACADELISLFLENETQVVRGYFHMLLHCMFFHPWPDTAAEKEIWNLASDLAVELVMRDALPESFWSFNDPKKDVILQRLSGKKYGVYELYEMIKGGIFEELTGERDPKIVCERLQSLFSFDCHDSWYLQDEEQKKRNRRKWQKIQLYTASVEDKIYAGLSRGKAQELIQPGQMARYDYSRFLKKFSAPAEEMELDLESFDYIYYTLGLELYGDMPLIEHLEYKEVNRLKELVIAIDTSGSCSEEMVQQFLTETLQMVSQKENFFHEMKVHLLQCDTHIEDAVVIHSREEWKQYCSQIKIYGRGGTDFRPVFRYIEEKQRAGEIKDLRALIYFTDGDGIYPDSKPSYETAFVLLKEKAQTQQVPDWAAVLLI